MAPRKKTATAKPPAEKWVLVNMYDAQEFDSLDDLKENASTEEYTEYYVAKVEYRASAKRRIDLDVYK